MDAQSQSATPTPVSDIEVLYRREYKELVRRLFRILKNMDDAEEVAQLAFLKFMERGPDLGTLRCTGAFLFHIARNLAIDHLRHHTVGRQIFAELDVDTAERAGHLTHLVDDAERGYLARDLLHHLDQALLDLPVKCRATFLMSKTEDKTYPEIAGAMGLSVSMIEKYMGRALKHVRDAVPLDLAA